MLPVVANQAVKPALPDDGSPITGMMAFHIDADRLELLGPLATTAGSPLVDIDFGAMAQADELPIGSLIAVDGWLSVLGIGATCPAAPDGATGSSPFAVCPAGWITADDGLPTDGPDRMALAPDGFGIRVQSNAYQAFAPDPRPPGARMTAPRRGTYLLRHVPGTASVDPPSGWRVVGRMDALEGAGPPTATSEDDGLLLELWLDKTMVPTDERLTSFVRVSNVGTQTPRWETSTCLTRPAPTDIEPSRPDESDTSPVWTGKAATFKRKLLAAEWRPELLIDIDMIDRRDVGCAESRRVKGFGPGSVSQMVLAWDAVDREGRPIIPGPAPVTSTFHAWSPGRDVDRDPDIELRLRTTVQVTGAPGEAVPLSQYADVALMDDAFRSWVQRQSKPKSWQAKAIFWSRDRGGLPDAPRYARATDGAVDIGMSGPGPVGRVTIDTETLDVLGRRLSGR